MRRLSDKCVKTLYDNLEKRDKVILRIIGDMDIIHRSDIDEELRTTYSEQAKHIKTSYSLVNKSLVRLEAIIFIDVKERGLSRARFLTEDGRYVYSHFVLGLSSDEGESQSLLMVNRDKNVDK